MSIRCVLSAVTIAACSPASSPRTSSPLASPAVETTNAEASPSAAQSLPPLAAGLRPPVPMPARYLRTLERDPGGYGAHDSAGESTTAGEATDLLLGDLLFHSPRTLGPRAFALGISCNTCHPNGATHSGLYLPGISDRAGNVDLSSAFFRPQSDDGVFDPINIPSLRGGRYTPPYGHDGRTASISEFVAGVVADEFGGSPLPPYELAALVHYVLDLDFLPNAKLDSRNRVTASAGEAARRGQVVFEAARSGFAGKSCASCHVPSSFFRDGQVHRLGTGSPSSPHALDDGFETPTLLGLCETAPYFHDGRFATLADVVAWFNRTFSLGMSQADAADLVAFLDAVGAEDRRSDDRPPATRSDQVFAYLALVSESTEPDVWVSAVDAVYAELTGEPESLHDRATELRKRLAAMRVDSQRSGPRAPLFSEARALRADLSRFAADRAVVAPAP